MNDFSSTPSHISTRRLANDAAGIAEAATLLRSGAVVAIPTETVYGLAADATNALAVAKIYAAKGRPSFNPLIAHCATIEEALALGVFDVTARALATRFWPGPLTLVVPALANGSVCELARAGLATIAIRVPDHPVARAIITAAGCPLAAPSANRSGHVSPTSAAHVLADLDGLIDAVVDSGECGIGVESTIIACIDGQISILRPGGLTREALAEVMAELGLPSGGTSQSESRGSAATALIAPGQLDSHYAPGKPVRLNALSARADEAYLGFGPVNTGIAARVIYNLSELGDVTEAASRFYQGLRYLDQCNASAIAVAPVPESGIGEAINDRLRRAAFR
jgi:L-threonylcarbamoyladenylate synthase